MNTNNTNKNQGSSTIATSATNGSSLLGKTAQDGETNQQAQLLECLEKLDLILANQNLLVQQLAAQGIVVKVNQAQSASSINA